jgi:outer membrane immunogenic protein
VLKQTQRLLLSGAAALALSSGTASAGPPPQSVWNGFYLGANGGVGMGADSATVTNIFSFFPDPNIGTFGGTGALAGVQAGFNTEFGNALVFGVEADADLASINGDRFFGGKGGYGGSLPFFGGKGDQSVSSHYGWLTTARVRVGVPIGNFLLFGTGGVAAADIKNAYTNATYPSTSFSQSGTRVGWVAGFGGEVAVSPKTSFVIQFLHSDFGSRTLDFNGNGPLYSGTMTFHNSLDVLTVGFNWKLP